mmetsp:Transcript_13448/g.25308  ORF Transcript_13448/g.25308 Transcript_13448/m.25308 type:complete len:1223 (+) Transcript_13448:3-3671(+)
MDTMGPLFTKSIVDQFKRVRDGDRFWYKNVYEREEYETFPSLSDIIKMVCDDMDLFPSDAYALYDPQQQLSGGGGSCSASSQLNLLDGLFSVSWEWEQSTTIASRKKRRQLTTEDRSILVTLSVLEEMEDPGFIGIGWGKQEMKGAQIWFCTVNQGVFHASKGDFPEDCSARQQNEDGSNNANLFSCCVASTSSYHVPQCLKPGDSNYYELEVADACLSKSMSSVQVKAKVCPDGDDDSSTAACFRSTSTADGKIDFIVAFNPFTTVRSHGYQRRTSAQVDLSAGILTSVEQDTVDNGLIATHGIFMLAGWLFLAPWGIFIVRYMKTRSWHLVTHISIMGVVGSMMIPLLIGVEASVGASDKKQQHSLVGLILLFLFFVMVAAGRIQYLKWDGRKVGKKTAFVSKVVHKLGGYCFIGLAWGNCYTGLVRIGPEDSQFQIVFLSSYSMGYDMPIFGAIRKYVYGPYIAFVVLSFAVAEFYNRYGGDAAKVMKGRGSLWDDDKDLELEPMTMEDVTRLGSSLCVVDGRVLDITDFIDCHPGGPELLRYVKGSDITDELLGKRDVDGLRHIHSRGAMKLLNKYAVGKLVGDVQRSLVGRSTRWSSIPRPTTANSSLSNHVYRRGRVVDVKYLTPNMPVGDKSHPVILLRIALPTEASRKKRNFKVMTSTPGLAFVFRGIDERGVMFERKYTPVSLDDGNRSHSHHNCFHSFESLNDSRSSVTDSDAQSVHDELPTSGEEHLDFIISLISGGKMSKFFLGLRHGKALLAQGPKTNPKILEKCSPDRWRTIFMLAAGTGVSSMLQLIDYCISAKSCSRLYLIWILKSPDHDYQDVIGLPSRAKRSKGKFKWQILYSSSPQNRRLTLHRRNTGFFGKDKLESSVKRPVLQRQDWAFSSVIEMNARFSRSLKYGVFKKSKENMNVKDLITLAPVKSADVSARTDLITIEDDQPSAEGFNSGTWSGKPRPVKRQFNEQVLLELLNAVKDHAALFDTGNDLGDGESQVDSDSSSSTFGPLEDIPGFCHAESKRSAPRRRSSSRLLLSGVFTVAEGSRSEEYEIMERGGLELDMDAWIAGQDLKAAADQFRSGISAQTHLFHFRRFVNTFVGQEAVTFMVKSNMAPTREFAVRLGQALMSDSKLFAAVDNSSDFKDGYFLYRYEESTQTGGGLFSLNEAKNKTTSFVDVEPEQEESPFHEMLVAVSGSPNFNLQMLGLLENVGVPRENTLEF